MHKGISASGTDGREYFRQTNAAKLTMRQSRKAAEQIS